MVTATMPTAKRSMVTAGMEEGMVAVQVMVSATATATITRVDTIAVSTLFRS